MPQAEFWIVLTQVRSYVFSIQYSVSHRIGNPVWIYNRTDHFFHTTISSHYVLDNTTWLLLLYSHTGLDNLAQQVYYYAILECETLTAICFRTNLSLSRISRNSKWKWSFDGLPRSGQQFKPPTYSCCKSH